eukprot:TRINITY_DN278_c0_g1_i2.p1 TRINITY_DN278_c0_g1~~TRINITY_DN278_c0_g1_i2.p1  ORF type:complete len:674 (+),score=172.67 TRINITY_DN278_c0_g1_i2:121-2142(+)
MGRGPRNTEKKDRKAQARAPGQYMTRSHAIKRLQVTLQDFRKLCILKGIFPRDPKKKLEGKNKTYYLTKDIAFLMHDPLLEKFRAKKSLRKKIRRAKGRQELDAVKRLEQNHPLMKLDHIIKERYPTFTDALRDMDDALCMVHLFARMPQTIKVPGKKTKRCARLANEFQNFVMVTHALRKVFVSVKGFYYQARIRGQPVTWLVPHHFSSQLNPDIDLRIMLTFLEFYTTLTGFVLFRLYNNLGLHYPPLFDGKLSNAGANLSALVLEQKVKEKKKTNEEDDEDDEGEKQELQRLTSEIQTGIEDNKYSQLFQGLHFFLGREVPYESLEFVIRSFGGRVSWESSIDNITEGDASVTHSVSDRPTLTHKFLNREYIQPQWIYDSVNVCALLPTHEYAPGMELPPHLSPFVDNEAVGYTPARVDQLNAILGKAGSAGLKTQLPLVVAPPLEGEEGEADKDAEEMEDAEEKKANTVSKASKPAHPKSQNGQKGAAGSPKPAQPTTTKEPAAATRSPAAGKRKATGPPTATTSTTKAPSKTTTANTAAAGKKKKGKKAKITDRPNKRPKTAEQAKAEAEDAELRAMEQQYREELAKETGTTVAPLPTVPTELRDDYDPKQYAALVLPNRKKRLFNAIQRRERSQGRKLHKLKERRKVIDAAMTKKQQQPPNNTSTKK